MASWTAFEADAPLLAERGRWLLAQHGGVAFLATLRANGAPQVRPIMPRLAQGSLWALIVTMSAKYGDLLRDPRYALHLIPAGSENLELHLEGRAVPCTDDTMRDAVAAEAGLTLHGFEALFELHIERAQSTRWDGWGTPAAWPEFTRWRAPRAS